MRKRILIVEDDKDILDIITSVLYDKHYHVIPSQKSEIMSSVMQIRPDLILMDNWLPGIDGSDICKRIKSDPQSRNIPVILISASSGLDKIARDCEADAFIEKPFSLNHLEEMVAGML